MASESEQQPSSVEPRNVMPLPEHQVIAEEIYESSFLSDETYPSHVEVQDIDLDANDFREKIKKRLQKALLGKKK